MKSFLFACCVALIGVGEARAGMVFAESVFAFSGSSTGDDPTLALGAPDLRIIQLGDAGGVLVLDFGQLLDKPGTLSIFTYDDLFPAAASVALSPDGSTFTVIAPFLWDTNGPIGPPYPRVDLAVTTPFRYVRFVSADDPDAGFDIDAVGFEASGFAAVPEPSTFAPFGLGAIGLILRGLRRRRHCPITTSGPATSL